MTAANLSNMVVEVLHNRGDDTQPDWSVGSGFFIGRRLVLTALHNVDSSGELLVRIHGTEERSAKVCLQGNKDIADLAILEVSDVAVDVPVLRYGIVDRSMPSLVKRCWAVGFPRFKERVHDPKPLRLTAQVDGEIPTGENLDQPLLTLQVRRSPRSLEGSAVRESEWAGMSGATVFSGKNILVGVITEHHLPEGESALTVVPITAIDLLPEATKWWELLGVDRQAFVRLPGDAHLDHPTTYLPFPRNTLFQPRPGEFERLETLFFRSDAHQQYVRVGLVGVTGMGGIGKTQLAVEFAYRYQDRFPAGIFWMPGTGYTYSDWQQQFAKLARNTDYLPPDDDPSNAENEARRARHFCRYLATHKDTLLILDNVEDPNLVTDVLPALAGIKVDCSILYTSRNQSAPPDVNTYLVNELPEHASLRLLLETTRPTLLAEVLAGRMSEEAQAARAVCHDVGYLPLALVHLRGLLARDRQVTLVRLAEVLKQRGALELAKTQQGDAAPLFATFRLSWEKIGDENARGVFKLACYFPEAAPIPLWLVGLASGLGEQGDIFEPLGEACLDLQELSMIEKLSDERIRLHPLVREFGRRLLTEENDHGKAFLEAAAERLATEFENLESLEQRAQRTDYWECLDQVRAARDYAQLLGTGQEAQLARIERWLDRESYLFKDEQWWPDRVPELFYQQIYNRSVEEEYPLPGIGAPAHWLRQMREVGTEDRSLLRIFAGHSSSVSSVAFSPDGTLVLTGSDDGTARVWETGSGKQVGIFEGHSSWVNSVAFSPDGTLVLTGSDDQTARVWETGSGKQVGVLEGHSNSVSSVAFSPDGHLAMTCDLDGRVFFWQLHGADQGKLLGLYVAVYEVGAIYWQDPTHLVLADLGGPHFRPHFYYLKLEGT